MIVLITELSESTNQSTLCTFVSDGLKRVWLLPVFRKGILENCEIRKISDPAGDSTEYQALIHMDDERTGEALIRQLNGKKLDGKTVQARRYHQRSPRKDRRVRLSDSHNIAIVDRRLADRRRPNLLLETTYRASPSGGPTG